MALKNYHQYNGINITYWKVSGVNISCTGKIAQIFIMGYIDEPSRVSDLDNKVIFDNYICKNEDFDKYFASDKNYIVQAYTYLKDSVDMFKMSEDC